MLNVGGVPRYEVPPPSGAFPPSQFAGDDQLAVPSVSQVPFVCANDAVGPEAKIAARSIRRVVRHIEISPSQLGVIAHTHRAFRAAETYQIKSVQPNSVH